MFTVQPSLLYELQLCPAGRGDLDLIPEAHVPLDHLPRHADIVPDLVYVVAGEPADEDPRPAQPV